MKNLKKIRLHEGDKVLKDLQLKKIVGGVYVDPGQPGGGGGGSTDYCSTLKCHNDLGYWDCYGPCRCNMATGTCVRI